MNATDFKTDLSLAHPRRHHMMQGKLPSSPRNEQPRRQIIVRWLCLLRWAGKAVGIVLPCFCARIRRRAALIRRETRISVGFATA
jgi:hypothetical protein